jgi:hypothetical protein
MDITMHASSLGFEAEGRHIGLVAGGGPQAYQMETR